MSDTLALIPLVLSAKKVSWRSPGEYESDSAFMSLRPKVLTRDDYKCRHCNFRAVNWQEIHHLNDDHNDHRLENLVTACAYCHMCHHIGLAGVNEEGILIWLPEISQIELNHLVRAIQIVKAGRGPAVSPQSMPSSVDREFTEMGKKLFDGLKARSEEAKDRIGTHNPETLANIFLRMSDKDYQRRGEFLAGIRLMPLGVRRNGNRDVMPEMVSSWQSTGGDFVGNKPKDWGSMLRHYSEALGNA